jgi:2-dehydropantoate 2-reductase
VTFVEANRRKVELGRRTMVGIREVAWARRDMTRTPFMARYWGEFVHADEWRPRPGGWVLLCTKCYDNPAVLDRLTEPVRLVPIQNGFDPRVAADGHEFEGIASFVSEADPWAPETRITRAGDLHLGRRVAGPTPDGELDQFAAALGRCGLFRVKVVPRIEPFKYAKLMYNAAISPLAAAAGIDNGKLLSVPAARRLFFGLLQENYRILTAAGVELGQVGPFKPGTVAWILRRKWLAGLMARGFEPSLRGTYCSMAGEIQKGRTEIDNYNGHLIRLAEPAGVPCPLNRAVYELVTRMTAERAEPRLGVLDELADEGRRPAGRNAMLPDLPPPGAEAPGGGGPAIPFIPRLAADPGWMPRART